MVMASLSRVMQNAVRPERERRQSMADHIERAKQLTGKWLKRRELEEVERSAMFLAKGHGLALSHALAKRAIELNSEGRFDDPFALEFMASARKGLEADRQLAQMMGEPNPQPIQELDVFGECLRVPFKYAAEELERADHLALITRAFRVFLIADELAEFATKHWDEHGWNPGFVEVWSEFGSSRVALAVES